ncbi:unnamed protein product [Caenorhabditis sp. 36 PRJEB53466]|nr:unnamed protein product [Caenorhabditis sp. 36 PRJEB53466]
MSTLTVSIYRDPKAATPSVKINLEMLRSSMNLLQKAKANDTEGVLNSISDLTSEYVKANSLNVSSEQLVNLTSVMRSNISSMGYFTKMPIFKMTTAMNAAREKLDEFGSMNLTEIVSNSTEIQDIGNYTLGNWTSADDDLSTGLDFGSMDEGGKFLGDGTTHSTSWSTASNFFMIFFVYYVPRMVYFRAVHFTSDIKQSSYVPILFLSLIALSAAVIHVLSLHHGLTSNPVISLIMGGTDEVDMFSPFIYKALTTSANRIVSPVIAVVCLQQLATYAQIGAPLLEKKNVHLILCLVFTAIVFGYTFYTEYQVYLSLGPEVMVYPDPTEPDLFDLVPPILTAVLFFFARQKVSRKSVYSVEKAGPNGPSTLDRVSKVVVFQVVMAIVAIVAVLMRTPDEMADSTYTFFICAQTPVVHWVLFRSLLRSRKPTRLCFLMCCSSEEKIASANEPGMELNQHPQTNEPSQKNEEDEEEEEATLETLDHNKIVLTRQSQEGDEKKEMAEKKND